MGSEIPLTPPPACDFDLVVVGSGPAGEKASIQAAKLHKRVAIIEQHTALGGACIHTATLPSKTLREAVLFVAGLEHRSFPGVYASIKKHQIGVPDLLRYKTTVVQHQADAVRRKLDRNDIETFYGRASFVDPHRLVIESEDGTQRTCTAAVVVLAVGSRPASPQTIPLDDQHVFDTDSILRLGRIPRSLAVIGAGVVGCEYASIFANLGVKVTLLDTRPDVLDFLDYELKQTLLYRLRTAGVIMHFGEEVHAVTVTDTKRVESHCASGKVVTAERVLYAAGRVGNTDRLRLDAIDLQTDQRGLLRVNQHFQTTVPHIYAVGDVIGFPALAATAMHQGRLASAHAFRNTALHDNDRIRKTPLAPLPFGIYTIPEVSMVGATEEQLTEDRVPYEIGHAFYRETARAHIMGDTEGMLKLIFHRETLQLLGVHIIGERAAELIHLGQAIIAYGGTIEYFIDNVVNYPTFSETYKVAALNGYNRL
jgi:NAD(P) transhydrogenase